MKGSWGEYVYKDGYTVYYTPSFTYEGYDVTVDSDGNWLGYFSQGEASGTDIRYTANPIAWTNIPYSSVKHLISFGWNGGPQGFIWNNQWDGYNNYTNWCDTTYDGDLDTATVLQGYKSYHGGIDWEPYFSRERGRAKIFDTTSSGEPTELVVNEETYFVVQSDELEFTRPSDYYYPLVRGNSPCGISYWGSYTWGYSYPSQWVLDAMDALGISYNEDYLWQYEGESQDIWPSGERGSFNMLIDDIQSVIEWDYGDTWDQE